MSSGHAVGTVAITRREFYKLGVASAGAVFLYPWAARAWFGPVSDSNDSQPQRNNGSGQSDRPEKHKDASADREAKTRSSPMAEYSHRILEDDQYERQQRAANGKDQDNTEKLDADYAHYSSREDYLYYNDNRAVIFNPDSTTLDIGARGAYGMGKGTVKDKHEESDIHYADVELDWVGLSAFTTRGRRTGETSVGFGIGTGVEFPGGGVHGEVFVLKGSGTAVAAGGLIIGHLGIEEANASRGKGYELSVAPEIGGAGLRAIGNLERAVTDWIRRAR